MAFYRPRALPAPGLREGNLLQLFLVVPHLHLRTAGRGMGEQAMTQALIVSVALLLQAVGPGQSEKPKPAPAPAQDKSPSAGEDRLDMAPAVACASIAGYEQFVPLEDAAITSDEKLLVYYRPKHYTIKKEETSYLVHLSQEARVRRRGEKTVLWSTDNLFDFKFENSVPPAWIYLHNKIALKGLPPGDYDLDITLHDVLAPKMTAQQILPFKIKAAPPAPPAEAESKESKESKEKNTSPKPPPAKKRRSGARSNNDKVLPKPEFKS
jgi:hypothetical protein